MYGLSVLFCLTGLLVVVVSRRLVRAFIGLLITLLSLAFIFFLAGAEFVAASQIMVYVGGVLVLMAFGFMLSARDEHQEPVNKVTDWLGSFTVSATLLVLLVWMVQRFLATTTLPQPIIMSGRVQTQLLGTQLMTSHLLPLEGVGLLLLIATVAALVVSRLGEQKGS